MRLNDIYPAVLTIVMIGVVLGIGLYVLAEIGGELATTVGSVGNETAYINETVYTVDSATVDGFNTFAVTICYGNATGDGIITIANATIASGNYTINSQLGTIVSTTSGTENYTDAKCSYTYLYGEDASKAIDSTVTGLGDFAGWIAVIVVVIAASIVLGIVLSSFGSRRVGI